ncbi:hypothetical protein BKA69DRAFT_1097880 [Paraphysoderma sedebokerense]|nr:hypothetical protein BKA69DRAFT_1097868 [Paraphysoderma sedebokerense]KAI9137447.1 hypothetical protein BKA69DRAFT_1097880 [Paraphysoderma sedebokerense]
MYQEQRTSSFWRSAKSVALRIMRFDEYYQQTRQYFVLVNLLQKLVLVAAGVFFTNQRGIQTVLTSLTLNATLTLSIAYKPYSHRILNTSEQLSFASSIAVLGLGLPFLTDSIDNSVRSFLTVSILSIIFGFILFTFGACLVEAKSRLLAWRAGTFKKNASRAPLVALSSTARLKC